MAVALTIKQSLRTRAVLLKSRHRQHVVRTVTRGQSSHTAVDCVKRATSTPATRLLSRTVSRQSVPQPSPPIASLVVGDPVLPEACGHAETQP